MKKNSKELFDVTMGSNGGAEVCELVGLYILNVPSKNYNKGDIGVYRDDGLAVFKNISGCRANQISKDNQNFLKTA